MAKAVVGNVSVLAELPQRPGCGWSADAALEAVAALEQLEPLSDALRGPQPAPPAEAAEELSSGEARTSFETALGSDGVLEPGSGAVEVHPNPNPAPNPNPDPNPSPNPNPNPNLTLARTRTRTLTLTLTLTLSRRRTPRAAPPLARPPPSRSSPFARWRASCCRPSTTAPCSATSSTGSSTRWR